MRSDNETERSPLRHENSNSLEQALGATNRCASFGRPHTKPAPEDPQCSCANRFLRAITGGNRIRPAVAKASSARNLHLVHVFEPDYPLASMAAMPLIVPELEVGKRVRRHLKDVAKKYSVQLRRENIHAFKGRPFEEICRLARDRSIDLIVTSLAETPASNILLLAARPKGSFAIHLVRSWWCVRVDRKGKQRQRKNDEAPDCASTKSLCRSISPTAQ